jgi:DNA-binding MarR family transcriptional regulator
MHVLVPEQVHNYSVEFNVRAIPLRGEGAVVRLMLKIVPTDLELSGPEFAIGSFVQGEIESITVRVRNNGPGPAGNVVVRAQDNGQLLGTETLTYVRAGDVRPATFTWAVTAGHHDLKFTVDPENRIFERNEENNELDYSVNAVTRTGPAPPVAPETIAGGTVIMTVAVAGVAAAWTETGRFKLMWLFWVPLYTKLKRTSILDHFVRGQVYGYIKANPGEHYNAIKKALALKNGTLVYHLQTLEREEYIKSVSDGRYKRFYPAGMKVPEEPLVRLNKIQEIILRLIGDRPAISQKEIADQIGLSGATINYHINVMLKANVIKMEKLGRTTHCYAIDEDGEVVEPTVVEEAEPQEPGSEEPKGP